VFVTSARLTRHPVQASDRTPLAHQLAAREIGQVSLENALSLVHPLRRATGAPFEKAAVKWLGLLLLEMPMPISLAAQCVEPVSQLSGPEAERVGKR
jgi:hypothetical protein